MKIDEATIRFSIRKCWRTDGSPTFGNRGKDQVFSIGSSLSDRDDDCNIDDCTIGKPNLHSMHIDQSPKLHLCMIADKAQRQNEATINKTRNENRASHVSLSQNNQHRRLPSSLCVYNITYGRWSTGLIIGTWIDEHREDEGHSRL